MSCYKPIQMLSSSGQAFLKILRAAEVYLTGPWKSALSCVAPEMVRISDHYPPFLLLQTHILVLEYV